MQIFKFLKSYFSLRNKLMLIIGMNMPLLKILLILLFCSFTLSAQVDLYHPIDLDTVKYSMNDFGGMWTFDSVPV